MPPCAWLPVSVPKEGRREGHSVHLVARVRRCLLSNSVLQGSADTVAIEGEGALKLSQIHVTGYSGTLSSGHMRVPAGCACRIMCCALRGCAEVIG